MAHISQITDADALTAARMTGLQFDSVRRTDWGLMVMCDDVSTLFCFNFQGNTFECGLAWMMTPNIHKVVDFLRERGYELGSLESLGHKVIEKRSTTNETSGEWRW